MITFTEILRNEYTRSLVIFLVAFAFARILHPILAYYLKKISQKTETRYDDVLIEILTKPIYNLILLIGLYSGVRSLSILQNYDTLIDKLFFTAVVILASYVISKVLSILISNWLQVQKKYQKTPQLISKVVTVVIYLIALMMILRNYNVEVSPLIATLGIGGLAVGLALQNTLANFFSGLYIISDRPINVGDFIEIDTSLTTLSGFVDDIGWRSTKIKTWNNTIVIIPNSKLAESTIVNSSLSDRTVNTKITCGVDYHSDLEKVENVTLETAKKLQKEFSGAVKDWEPVMRFNKFADSNIEFFIVLKATDIIAKSLLAHEFIKVIKKSYDKAGIEISFPVRKMYTVKN